MNYTVLIIALFVFFLGLSFFVLAWSKKPTKQHIKEIEEAGFEVAKQINEATEENLKKLEKQMTLLDEKYERYEKQQLAMIESVVRDAKKEIEQNAAKVSREAKPRKIELTNETSKKIYHLYQQKRTVEEIAKELKLYTSVVNVHLNLLKMSNVI